MHRPPQLADAPQPASPGRVAPTAGIASVAVALPEHAVTSAEIGAPLGVDEDWILTRTGVRERRRVAEGESLVSLAAEAGRRALERAEVPPGDVDLVLVATFTQDDLQPHAAPLVAERVGAGRAGALDVGAACTGFLAGLSLAAGQIEAGRARAVLVVGAELLSRITDYEDRKTAALFGDGAGAAVISAGGPGRIGSILLRSDAEEGADCIWARHDERLLRMRGQDVFRAAVARLTEVTLEAADQAGIPLDDVDLFVYHQANARITAAVGERLGVPRERVVNCIERYGNTSSASLPIALCEAEARGQLRPGANVLLAAFASGFVWGAGMIEWGLST